MAGTYRYSAALDKTYVEQRWADSVRPAALQAPAGRTAVKSLAPAAAPAVISDPLRFVKTGQAPLVRQARDQLQVHETVQRKKCLAAQDEQEEQWQTNLDEWKSRRRKASLKAFQRVQDAKQLFPDSSQNHRRAPEQYSRRKQTPSLTTGTELLSEYSSKAAPPGTPRSMVTAPTQVQSPEPAWNDSMETASTQVQSSEPGWSNSMETASTKVQAPESKAAKPEATMEATLSVSGRRLCSHCNQPLG
ncbi:unnamed protein product, partial [Ixodes hexagonus]